MKEITSTIVREITDTTVTYKATDGTKFDKKRDCAFYELNKARYGAIGDKGWYVVHSEDELRNLIKCWVAVIGEVSYSVELNDFFISSIVRNEKGMPVAKKIGEHYEYVYEYSFEKSNISYPTMVAFHNYDYEDDRPVKVSIKTLEYELSRKEDVLSYYIDTVDKLKKAKTLLKKGEF